jgi:ABC-type transport system involved in cytochrome c biogenesis ATPase subunit
MSNTELIDKLRNYLVHRDAVKLRDLSGEASDLAFITQDKDTVNIAIIAYALYKIFLKTHYQNKFEALASNAQSKINSGDLEG